MPTKTGSFPIGFRRGRSAWQQDLPSILAWAKLNHFQSFDLNVATPADVNLILASGLQLGTVDLLRMGEIAHPDEAQRSEIVAQNVAYVKQFSAAGVKIFLTVVGGDRGKTRAENYKIAVEAFAPIAEAAADTGTTIAIEGLPGAPPHLAMLCTTPETCRRFLRELPRGVALNYDPSHLIRLEVDHVRFLNEFADHVVHVHGKDTQIFPEAMYEFGRFQPGAFSKGHGFGEQVWRYAIPGKGGARWSEIFEVLASNGYRGMVGIELEDEDFNGTAEGEKKGLIQSLDFLSNA